MKKYNSLYAQGPTLSLGEILLQRDAVTWSDRPYPESPSVYSQNSLVLRRTGCSQLWSRNLSLPLSASGLQSLPLRARDAHRRAGALPPQTVELRWSVFFICLCVFPKVCQRSTAASGVCLSLSVCLSVSVCSQFVSEVTDCSVICECIFSKS